jgi:AraC-like DNA-binding protein
MSTALPLPAIVSSAGAAANLRADADAAIAALGARAATMVPIASLAYYGNRLGWPAWLYTGSSLEGTNGPPPAQLSVADDLILGANLFAHVSAAALASQAVSAPQPATGSVTRLALAHTPTLGAVFAYLQRLIVLSTPQCRPVMGEAGGLVFVGLEPAVPLGGLLDYLGILFIAVHYRVVEDLGFGNVDGASIALTLPEGPESAAIGQIFRVPVQLGATTNRLYMPAAWLDLRNPGHDAALWALAGERLREAELQFRDNETINQLRRRIADMLTNQRKAPRLKQVAQAEAMSTRSLVRHIAAAGHSFHGLVDQERRLRAAQLINDPELSIRAIADQLGFPDVSSFGRKFRQWFGDSPAHFRRNRP